MFNSIKGTSFIDFKTIGFPQGMPIESSSTDGAQSTPILEISELSVEFQQKDKDLVQSLRKELIEHEFRGLPYGLLRKLDEIQSDKLHDDFVLDISKKIYSEYLDDNFLSPSRYEYAELINQIRNPETRMNSHIEAAKDQLSKEKYFEMREFLRDIEPGKTRDSLVSELTSQLYSMKNYKELPSTLDFMRDGKQKDELIVTFTEKLLEAKEYGFAAATLAILDSVKVKDDYSIKFFNELCEQKLYGGVLGFCLLLSSEKKHSDALIYLSGKLFNEELYSDARMALEMTPPSDIRDEALLSLSTKLFDIKEYSEARLSLRLFNTSDRVPYSDSRGYRYDSFKPFRTEKRTPALTELAHKLFDAQQYKEASETICSTQPWENIDLYNQNLIEFSRKFFNENQYQYAYDVLKRVFDISARPLLLRELSNKLFDIQEYEHAINTLSSSNLGSLRTDPDLITLSNRLFQLKEYGYAIKAASRCMNPKAHPALIDLSDKLVEAKEYSYAIDALKYIRQGKKQEDLAALSGKLFDLKEYNHAVAAIRAISFCNPYFPSESNKYRQKAATELADKLDAVAENSFSTQWLAKVCREC
ncbi:MAG: hypothetical protein V4489_07595 [Chlamydiota bacterium]